MAITPDYSHGIVALTLHIRRVYVCWHLVDLQNLAAVHLIDAASTLALDAELVRIDCLAEGLTCCTCSS